MNLQAQIKPELWDAISKQYQNEHYRDAILESMRYLTDVIREKSGIGGDGVSLVGDALNVKSPRIKINKLQTDSEVDAQKGLIQILMGMYTGIRNPRTHERVEDDVRTAEAIICFINYILGVLERSHEPFVLEEFLLRGFDTDFVETDQYAELLVEEIPSKKLLDTLIAIYREKNRGNGSKLKYMVKAISKKLSPEQMATFMSVVSDELRITQSDDSLRLTLQMLSPDWWMQVNELARIRIENKLINYLREGYAYEYEDRIICNKEGALATWSASYWKHFLSRTEIGRILLDKLAHADVDQNRFVTDFLMSYLPDVIEDEDQESRLVEVLSMAVKNGEWLIKRSLIRHIYSMPKKWQELLGIELMDLTDFENPATYLYDGTPFLTSDKSKRAYGTAPSDLSDIPF